MERGAIEYETPGGCVRFPEGSGGIINADVLHISRKLCETAVQRLHIFDASFIGGQPDGRIAQKYIAPIINAPGLEVIPLMPDNPAHAGTLSKIRESFKIDTSDFRYELKLRETLEDIWVDLLGLMPEERSDTYATSIKIKQMMVFVQEHYSERLKISDIADAAYVSERDCYRVFQTFLHTTPADYLKSCRIQAACRMLAGGDDSITRMNVISASIIIAPHMPPAPQSNAPGPRHAHPIISPSTRTTLISPTMTRLRKPLPPAPKPRIYTRMAHTWYTPTAIPGNTVHHISTRLLEQSIEPLPIIRIRILI